MTDQQWMYTRPAKPELIELLFRVDGAVAEHVEVRHNPHSEHAWVRFWAISLSLDSLQEVKRLGVALVNGAEAEEKRLLRAGEPLLFEPEDQLSDDAFAAWVEANR